MDNGQFSRFQLNKFNMLSKINIRIIIIIIKIIIIIQIYEKTLFYLNIDLVFHALKLIFFIELGKTK